MAQCKPEDQISIKQVLKLVDKLSSEECTKLLQLLTNDELGSAVQKGIDTAGRLV